MSQTKLEKTLNALRLMTTNLGILQHESDPNIEDKKENVWPYSIDDNARASIAESELPEKSRDKELINVYLEFIKASNRNDGWFDNYRKRDKSFIQDNPGDLQDCYGRANWALAEFIFSNSSDKKQKKEARELIFSSLSKHSELTFPIAQGLSVISFCKYLEKENNPDILLAVKDLANKLSDSYKKFSDPDWKFPYHKITYCGARIPQAFLLAGKILDNLRLIRIGKESLDFIVSQSFENGMFNPIGINWLKKGETRTFNIEKEGDKQPVEANVTAEVLYSASKILNEPIYTGLGSIAFNWITGFNKEKFNLLADNGAVFDAITKNSLNLDGAQD